MRTKVKFSMKVGKRSYRLYFDCDVNYTDVLIIDNKYVTFFGNNVSIDEKNSHKDYKKAFEVTPDGDYHVMVEFKKNPKSIRVFSQYSEYKGPNLCINIDGE